MSRAIAFTGPHNRALLEDAYARYQADANSVDPTWQAFFAGVEFGGSDGARSGPELSVDARIQSGAVRLITAFRDLGHLAARIDPLAETAPEVPWLISFDRVHLTEADLGTTVDASMYFGMNGGVTLRELHESLKETYCGTIGVEYMHIQDVKARRWLAERMEPRRNRPNLPLAKKMRALMTLHQAELFEKFLHTKYVGQKRFSLEGAEIMLPVLDAIVERSPGLGIKEIVIGMAHRGRLTVLATTMQKPPAEIFNEFEDKDLPDGSDGDGDVKYHLGYSSDVTTSDGGSVHVTLTPNPSHLEIVNPVVEGRVRAKQRLHGDTDRSRGVPLLIHGDAAFAGQGVVAETLNMARLSGYATGGTVHVVVNNQIGFTTVPSDGRSTQYCTDVAKFVQAPVFHVNGDDPEAAVFVAELALEYRQQFKSDVVIDLVCYRYWGHNESDEPFYTQPVEYRKIRSKEKVAATYTKALVAGGFLSQADADAIDANFKAKLEADQKDAREGPKRKKGMKGYGGRWSGLSNKYSHAPVPTAVGGAVLDRIADQIPHVPAGFALHPKLQDILGARRDNIRNRKSVDWGTAEALTFGSLVLEGHAVRLSGQDSRRGTFSHRHAYVYDQNTGDCYCPLANLDPGQAPFDVYNSLLSEAAVLGFEYGYSLDDPDALVMWEAQFGDFVNGAQVIIDQFISSGETKWTRASGLVLLLPHGHEGIGPEHTSARPERFLQMCAENNMQVCNFTTPANYFHAMRRQVLRPFRKPLIVMTPKSLLRSALSPVEEFISGQFQEIIDDTLPAPDRVRRVLLCSGKVYYDLLAKRTEMKTDEVAILRMEQLYPWPQDQLQAVLAKYRRAVEWKWVQEESQNNGGWTFAEPQLRAMGFPFEFVGRDASASPATGSHHAHEAEQKDLVDKAFTVVGTYAVTGGRITANGTHTPKPAGKA